MAIATTAEFEAWADLRGIILSGDLDAALYIAENDFLNVRYTFKDGVTDEQKKPALLQAAYQQTLGRLFVDPLAIQQTGVVESESSAVGSLSESITYKSGTAVRDVYPTQQIDYLLRGLVEGSGGLGSLVRW